MHTYHLFDHKPMIKVIVNCIYTPTGKKEDLWETRVKRALVFKCLGAYKSIS